MHDLLKEVMMPDLEELVFQALGEASMCWSERPKGVFDSDYAKEVGERLVADIKHFYVTANAPRSEEYMQMHNYSNNPDDRVDPATALFAFAGWLTSREEVSGPFSARHDAAGMVELVKAFCQAQAWNVDDAKYEWQIKELRRHYPRTGHRVLQSSQDYIQRLEAEIRHYRTLLQSSVDAADVLLSEAKGASIIPRREMEAVYTYEEKAT